MEVHLCLIQTHPVGRHHEELPEEHLSGDTRFLRKLLTAAAAFHIIMADVNVRV